MYKSLLALALMWLSLLSMSSVQAQQVLSNGGGSFENGGTTMTFTVGETVISTFNQSNGTMIQGFNIPRYQLSGNERLREASCSNQGPLDGDSDLPEKQVDGATTVQPSVQRSPAVASC